MSEVPGSSGGGARRRPVASLPWLIAALLLGVLLLPGPARAGTIEAGETRVRSEDPRAISFSIRVQASAGLERASLEYKVLNPDGNVGGSGEATFAPGAETDASFELEAISNERYIPVGSEFVFHWELVDRDGVELATPEERYLFLDGRYDWQTRTVDDVTVLWYGSSDDAAELALSSARDAIVGASALLETTVPYPIRVVVWRSEAEGELAMRPRASTFDAQVTTGGQRVAPHLLFVFTPNVDVIRHEAAHIVTHVAGDGPFTSIPAWLDEGTAVFMQRSPGPGYSTGVEFAIASNSAIPLRSLQSPSNNPSLVNQFYGQSWSTVDFMVSEYGEAAFAEVYRRVREGSRTDDALEAVYGVDQDGLYNLWREANGLAAIDVAPRTDGTAVPSAAATVAPLTIPQGGSRGATATPTADAGAASTDATPPGSNGDPEALEPGGDDGGSNTRLALLVGGGALLLALILGGGGALLLRRTS